MLVIANAVAFERRVDDGKLLDGDDGGAHEKWHESEARAITLLESTFELVAQVDDARQIDFKHAVDVRAGTARLDHALGDDLAHLGQGNKIAGNCGGGGRRGTAGEVARQAGQESRYGGGFVLDVVEYILLGDAASGTGAMDFCEIDIVLASEFAHERGGADIGVFFVGGRSRGWRRRRGQLFSAWS